MQYNLPALPYKEDALEPILSKRTLEIHYGKHHATYVANLNQLVVGTPFENQELETIIVMGEGAIFNNAAQVWNHTFFFQSLAPLHQGGEPDEALKELLLSQWGSMEEIKKQFIQAGSTLFGSGWVWLAIDKQGKPVIMQGGNATNPLQQNYKPLLVFDVWEHAYYLDYQNRRVDYLNALWELINWNEINHRYQELKKK